MSKSILTLKTRREALARQSIVNGYFNFNIISSFQVGQDTEAWVILHSLHGELLSRLSATALTYFYKYLSAAMGIDISSLLEPQTIKSQHTEVKQVEDYWISQLKAYSCTFQDIPLLELTERICRVAVKINPKDFYYVPDSLKTIKLCHLAMEKEPAVLFFLADDLLSESLCKKAVSLDAQLIHQIPVRHLNKDTWLAAVSQNGLMLRHCPQNIVTSELAYAAVRANGPAIALVPMHLLTPRLCELAIGSTPHGASLDDIPTSFHTEKLRLLAVAKNPMMLALIPAHEQTEAVRLVAVKGNGQAIQFIPVNNQSKLISFHALLNNMDSHPWVAPQHLYKLVLLMQQISPDPRFPKDTADAVRKLVRAKCSISELFAKSYLSQYPANEVVPQVHQSIRNAQALSRIYNTMELTSLFRKLHIRGALFAQDLNL